jgi:transposase
MLTAEFSDTKKAWIQLRWESRYYKTQHSNALQREKVLRAEVLELESSITHQNLQVEELTAAFNKTIDDQNVQIRKLTKHIEELKAQNAWLKQRLFGRQTEQSKDAEENDDPQGLCLSAPEAHLEKRPRGQQKGAAGHGRKLQGNLPWIEVTHDLKEHEKICPVCGLPFNVFPTTQDSQDIHYEVRLIRRVHKRKCYIPACHCGATAGIVAAAPVAKLIPKGMFSVELWGHILAEKFLFQRPMSRILLTLALQGLRISQGTITGGLEKIKTIVYPLYTRILEHNREANHWHMDETRWMMFVHMDGKIGYHWWLWVAVTKDTVAYIIDPSRSSRVVKDHLGERPKGIISADRYSAYKAYRSKWLKIAFCWGHVRRDYVRIYDASVKLRPWAQDWINRINALFHINNNRVEVLSDKDKFQYHDQALRKSLKSFRQTYVKELERGDLHPAQHKALKSLREHWSGLLIFVDHPRIPMDNNLSERKLREPALGRKNYYGCAATWSGNLTAALFTIFQTARHNGLHPTKFLNAYLQAAADNHGNPPRNIDDFLPWNLSQEQKISWKIPP